MDFKSSLEFLRNKYSKQLSNQHTHSHHTLEPLHSSYRQIWLLQIFFLSTVLPAGEPRLRVPRCHVLGHRSFALLDQDIGNRSNELVLWWRASWLHHRKHKQTVFHWLTITGIWSASRLWKKGCLYKSEYHFSPNQFELLLIRFQVFLMKLEIFLQKPEVFVVERQSYHNNTTWWYLKKQVLEKRAIVNSS